MRGACLRSRWRRCLSGCLTTDTVPGPGRRGPAEVPRRRDQAARRAAVAGLVARLSLARADRAGRARASRQSRHRGGGRAHRAGRRADPHRRRAAAAADRFRRLGARASRHRHRRRGSNTLPRGAQRQLRDRLLGQEPRSPARRRRTWAQASPASTAIRSPCRASHRPPPPTSRCSAPMSAGPSRARTSKARAASSADHPGAPGRRDGDYARVWPSRRAWSANLKAQIPPLDQEIGQNEANLAILLGRAPERITVKGRGSGAVLRRG